MTGFATNAFVSPAIFLAIEAAETKQANGSPRGSLKMNPPGASQDEIDPAVIRRVAEGDTVAFERVYDAFSGILYSLALRMLERPEDTEELLQEVFLKIWRDAEAYDPRRGVPLAWAITITRHKAIDKIRSTTRRLRLYDAAEAEAKNNCVPLPKPVNNVEHPEKHQPVHEQPLSSKATPPYEIHTAPNTHSRHRNFPLERTQNTGIDVHTDAGKTTITERVLF